MKLMGRRVLTVLTAVCLVAAFTVPTFAEDMPSAGTGPDVVETPDKPDIPEIPGTPDQPDKPDITPGFHHNANGSVTYYEKDGTMVKGWKLINGKKYYFSQKNGHMVKGWKTLKGKWYYFNKETGAMFKGFHKIGKFKYYFNLKTGAMFKGLHKIGNEKYYFEKKNGHMLTGLVKRNGNVYNINKKGQIQRIIYGKRKAIALTYDDGPADGTMSIVNTLKANDSVATFFVVGNRAGIYPESIKAAAKAGCQIASHTYSHPWLSTLSPPEIESQIRSSVTAIKKRSGKAPTVCRTPGGENTATIRNSVGMPIILWSIDTRDWATRDAGATYKSVINNASDGDIVLMHDLHYSTAVASKRIIPKLRKMGFQLCTVEELALLKGVKLKAGHVYSSF